jgi:hypothetical protein
MKKQRWRAKDYVVIPRSILTQKISPSALRLWVALASFCYDDDKCWPSNRKILERMPEGTALGTVKNAKRELEKAGLIKRDRRFIDGRETSSVYFLLAPKDTEMIEGGNETVTPSNEENPLGGNATVTPLNKYILNKNTESSSKKTVDGWVYDKGEGRWVEEL